MAFALPVMQAVGSFIAGNFMSVATLAAAGLNAYGQIQAGKAEARAATFTAAQMDARAKQERAVSQLEAARRRREGKAQLSQQKSLMAASGFAADDPSSLHLVSETVGAQTLEELLVLAQGEDSARQMEFEASQTRMAGQQAKANARTGALTTLAGNMFSWYDRYGGGGRARKPGATKPRYAGTLFNHETAHAGGWG